MDRRTADVTMRLADTFIIVSWYIAVFCDSTHLLQDSKIHQPRNICTSITKVMTIEHSLERQNFMNKTSTQCFGYVTPSGQFCHISPLDSKKHCSQPQIDEWVSTKFLLSLVSWASNLLHLVSSLYHRACTRRPLLFSLAGYLDSINQYLFERKQFDNITKASLTSPKSKNM